MLELPNLGKYSNVSVVSHQNPRVAEVLDQMREIFRVLGSKGEKTIPKHRDRILTRMHVHTLAFQAIMVDLRSQWKNTRAAVTKAALVAHRHVCHKKEVEVSHSNILMDEGFSLSTHPNTGRVMFDALKPVSCWIEDTHYQICIAPVLVCTKVQQTAGGGDNISAAGLVLQI
ncbi:ADP-dependent glucokinase [Armadillidium vulgare]|nr:ADP-dependent glucokinase [Armadillidium vulgare]